MTTSTVDRLVTDYLARLEAASAALEPERRDELLAEIAAHIAAARARGDAPDEPAVRTLLDRLGPPEVIAAAALDDGGPGVDPLPGGVSAPPGTGLELSAVLLLTAGSFVPVVGWLVGAVLLWVSSRWTTAEKVLGTLVVPLGPGGALWLGALPTASCGELVELGPDGQELSRTVECSGLALPAWIGVPLLLLAVVAPVVVAVVLYRRARARAALEPPRTVRPTPWGGTEVAAVVLLGSAGVASFALGPLALLLVVVGLVLTWVSPRWSRRDKALATALSAVPLVLFAGLFGLPLMRSFG